MNLLDVLASGVRGAEGGTAEIRSRGTSTFAQLFTSYDGTGAVTPTAGVLLDSNGGATWYVNESVDIVVKNSTGNTVRTFTAMVSASDVEVRSASFTGTNYTTGVAAAGEPTTAAAVFDLWTTSAGTRDWKVTIDGTPTLLTNAFAAFSGIFYNVKAPAYGAVGDGSGDDTSAVQAALTAAGNVGGGIVFFPEGTYRTTSALTVPAGVSLWGPGPNVTNIGIDHANANALTFAANTFASSVRGLNILALQANSGKHLVVESGTRLFIENCHIGAATTSGIGLSVDNAATLVRAVDTVFQNGGAASYGIQNNGTAARVVLVGCEFKMPATHNGDACYLNSTTSSVVVGCRFDASAVAAGTGRCLLLAGSYTVAGNRFESPAGGTIQPIGYSGTTAGNFVGLNSRSQSSTWSVQSGPTVATSNATHEGGEEVDRATRTYHVTDNTDPITVNPNLYGVAEVRRTNNGNQTINGATPSAPGLMFTLVVNNDNAVGSGTITLGSDFKGKAPFTLAANRAQAIVFRSYEVMAAGGGSAVKYWGFVNTTGDVTL